MTGETGRLPLRYALAAPEELPPRYLVFTPADGGPVRYAFHSRLDIGRDDDRRTPRPGELLVADPTISREHCVITQRPDGRCFVRDVSRNGTRLAGRRLVPNVEAELRPGDTLAVGGVELVLDGDPGPRPHAKVDSISTIPLTNRSFATVLVGDIRDYTVLVRTALSEDLQRAVNGVFERLSAAVVDLGGTVKEYQGDAILAFWEGDATGTQALAACRGALALDALAVELGREPGVWPLKDSPLRMDWALATGLVLIDSFGRGTPMGLSMMGEPVVRAFRIEKFANDETGRIVTCGATREIAAQGFRFRDLGEKLAKGFDLPDHVFALLGAAS